MSRRPLFPPVFEATHSHPLVDDFSLRAARHQQKQAPGTPISANLPLRQHPMWSGNNELGFQLSYSDINVGFLAKGDSVDRQTILKLNEWGAPEVWSVMLGISYDETFANPTTGFRVICEAQIGCGGTTQEVLIDWKRGTCFSAPMNAITVNATFSAAIGIPPDLRIRATIAKGDLSTIPPTYSVSPPIIGAATLSELVPIPPFAQRIYLMGQEFVGNNIYNAGNSLFLYGSTNVGSKLAELPADAMLSFSSGLPIPALARYVAYNNQAIAGLVQPIFVFELSL